MFNTICKTEINRSYHKVILLFFPYSIEHNFVNERDLLLFNTHVKCDLAKYNVAGKFHFNYSKLNEKFLSLFRVLDFLSIEKLPKMFQYKGKVYFILE